MGTVRGREVDVEVTGSNAQIEGDKSAAWANSAAANTVVQIDLAQVGEIRSKYRVQIYNPSSVTAISVTVYNRVKVAGVVRSTELVSDSVPTGTAKEILVEGMFGGTDGVRLALSNATALGLSDGFTADMAVREA